MRFQLLEACPNGWHAQKRIGVCYYSSLTEKKNFPDAQADCVSKGGNLVAIRSQGEQDNLEGNNYLKISVATYEVNLGITSVAQGQGFRLPIRRSWDQISAGEVS